MTEETCFCVGAEAIEVVPAMSATAAVMRVEHLTMSRGTAVSCRNRYQGRVLGFEAQRVALDREPATLVGGYGGAPLCVGCLGAEERRRDDHPDRLENQPRDHPSDPS